MRPSHLLAALVLAASAAFAEPILTEDFEQQGKWQKQLKGKGSLELVEGGVEGKCLKVVSEDKALAYYSIELDPKQVAGKRLIIRARVKLDNVVVGPDVYSTAKLHVGIRVGKQVVNRAQRFVGTRDWHDQVLVAPIPEGATRVGLDLGIQNGTGTAWFDSLVVDDGVKEHVPLNLKPVANASTSGTVLLKGGAMVPTTLDLRGLPAADVKLAGTDFYVMTEQENFGRTWIALAGAAQPKLPRRFETVVPVGSKGSRLFFLLAAAGLDPSRKAPCLVAEVHYEDGKAVDVPMREGVDVGAFAAPEALANWKIAWTARRGDATIGLGVTTWTNPRPASSIRCIRLRSPGTGAVPIVVAISLDPKGT